MAQLKPMHYLSLPFIGLAVFVFAAFSGNYLAALIAGCTVTALTTLLWTHPILRTFIQRYHLRLTLILIAILLLLGSYSLTLPTSHPFREIIRSSPGFLLVIPLILGFVPKS